MTVPTRVEANVRVPNLPLGAMVNEQGLPTIDMLTFLQTLVTNLQRYLGNEGLVAPTQTATNITTIQNNTVPNPSGGSPVYTCQYGTIIYDSTNNLMKMVIDNGSGAPIFKTVTLT